jgi:hypothetical protein
MHAAEKAEDDGAVGQQCEQPTGAGGGRAERAEAGGEKRQQAGEAEQQGERGQRNFHGRDHTA